MYINNDKSFSLVKVEESYIMQYIQVDKLKGEEILAVPILAASDIVLIHADTVIKKEYIEKLLELQIKYVYIKDNTELINELENKTYGIEETKEKSLILVKSILEHHIYKNNKDLIKVKDAAEKILESVISEPNIINNITEVRNISTDMYSHSINVCVLSTIIAISLHMNPKKVRNIAIGAMLHDIGLRYISVPYINIDILDMNYKDTLEYKKHTILGYSSIQEASWLSETSKEIILLHHEREDGSGYPFQKKLDKIKPEVKLVSLCDDFDSFISGIGNKKMKIYEAIEYIKVSTGSLYEETIAMKLMELIAIYPLGMRVITNEDEIGVVVKQNSERTDRPVIRMLVRSDGREYQEEVNKDLMTLLTLFIVDTVE